MYLVGSYAYTALRYNNANNTSSLLLAQQVSQSLTSYNPYLPKNCKEALYPSEAFLAKVIPWPVPGCK